MVAVENALLNESVSNLEQYTKKNNIIIPGIPQETENWYEVVSKLRTESVHDYDISTIHILPSNRTDKVAIIAKFNNTGVKNLMGKMHVI